MKLGDADILIKIIIGVLTIFGIILAGLWKWSPRIKSLFASRKAIIFVGDEAGYRNFWHMGTQGGKPILQVDCSFMASNITDKPIALAKASLRGIQAEQDFAAISVKDVNSQYSGQYDIPPGRRTTVSICFIMIPSKMPEKGKSIKLHVGIVDQFGKQYWVKNVVFRPT